MTGTGNMVELKRVSSSSLNRCGKFIFFLCWANAKTGQKLPKILCHLQMKKKKKEIERRSYGDKKLVMDQARKHLKDTEFHVYDDIPKML